MECKLYFKKQNPSKHKIPTVASVFCTELEILASGPRIETPRGVESKQGTASVVGRWGHEGMWPEKSLLPWGRSVNFSNSDI